MSKYVSHIKVVMDQESSTKRGSRSHAKIVINVLDCARNVVEQGIMPIKEKPASANIIEC